VVKETWLAGQMGAIFFSLLACDEEAALAGLADAWRDVGWLGSSVGGSASHAIEWSCATKDIPVELD